MLTTIPPLMLRSRMNGSCIPSPPCRLHGGSGTALLFYSLLYCKKFLSNACNQLIYFFLIIASI
jgi:hypothetical protein